MNTDGDTIGLCGIAMDIFWDALGMLDGFMTVMVYGTIMQLVWDCIGGITSDKKSRSNGEFMIDRTVNVKQGLCDAPVEHPHF